MARIYYSAARGGFFHEALHTALPEDAVRIAALRHAELMGAQSEGRQIIADARGRPVLAPVRVPGLEELRAQANRALDAEAERRILALASLARQSNDNALIAQAALAQASGKPAPEGLADALARRAAIDALRAIANRIAAQIATMPAANLTGFDAAAARLWGRADMAKISQLPLVTEPDGSETFVVLKDGMAQRVPGAALIGAAGEVSLEQVQAAASAAQTSAQGASLGPKRRARRQRRSRRGGRHAEGRCHRRRPRCARAAKPQPLRDRLCLHHRAGPFEVFGFHVAGAAFTWPADFAGAFVHAVVDLPGAALVLTLKVDKVPVASFTCRPTAPSPPAARPRSPSAVARSSPSKAPPRPMPARPRSASP
jgi:hypothetical protein